MKIGIALIIVFILGGFLGSQFLSMPSVMNMSDDTSHNESAEEKPLYWVAPMDKNYRRDGPGLSPMGMELVPVYANSSADEADGGSGSVTISAAVENNLGVRTAEVNYSDLYQPIDTVGTVQLDESKIKHIHSRVEGWIEVLNVSAVGDPVKKGQTLYELYSPALVNAQEEYLAALRSANTNLIKASKSRLFSLGLNEQHAKHLEQRRKVEQRVKVIAEMDGVVINLMVRQGMFIKPATEVVSIASLDSVWILGEVFERQSYLVNLGQEVEINFKAMPAKQWQGKISYIYPQLDARTRTLQVRINIDNPKHILKPNMFANLRIISELPQHALSIPKQALIKSSNHNRVVKSLGDGKYQSVLLELGYEGLDEDSGMAKVQILDGLEEGDRVVTSAQFLIDSESNVDAELDRLTRNEPPSAVKNNDSVMAMGVINSVMAGHDMLNITHEPVEEWGWPDMTMNFDVDGTLDLSQLSEGERIHFTIKKYQDGSIMITDFMSMSEHKHMSQEASE